MTSIGIAQVALLSLCLCRHPLLAASWKRMSLTCLLRKEEARSGITNDHFDEREKKMMVSRASSLAKGSSLIPENIHSDTIRSTNVRLNGATTWILFHYEGVLTYCHFWWFDVRYYRIKRKDTAHRSSKSWLEARRMIPEGSVTNFGCLRRASVHFFLIFSLWLARSCSWCYNPNYRTRRKESTKETKITRD